MFWSKQKKDEIEVEGVVGKVAAEAEGLFRSGKMHCAEAVLAAIRSNFAPQIPEAVVRMASGFGGGSGSGCVCGAVAGGTIALALVLQEDKKQISSLTKELHKWFKEQYGATCCKVITQKDKGGCPLLTGNVAGKVAEMLKVTQEK
ncbi:C-GCAxxG-C-C family protein [Geotalea toluenoxydans]|uniref:C-GCAxxG-C-C family protein n=1 Tax=Geotalea toluenoxydans TaxID=421624 RepID=UPI0006D10361|nr:C-GCAxxG-C-C family protein [Geotalea toluenoxydans]